VKKAMYEIDRELLTGESPAPLVLLQQTVEEVVAFLAGSME
jgi:hypothetical protein